VSSNLLDSLIKDIENRVRAEDRTAIERAAGLAERYPDEPDVWSLLAYAHDMRNDMDGAVLAMTRMMDVAPSEPMTFFSRGRYEHCRGNLEAALADFNEGIALSHQLQYTYYLELLYFRRADVLAKLGRKAEARADLVHVRDDNVEWSPTRRTKADILADCEE
jgi:tetratricopeptide (TPR) repeat protein